MNILEKADELIHGERVQLYGSPEITFGQAAQIASIITGKPLTASDLCLIQVALKLVRNVSSPTNPDHITDCCGYLGIYGDLKFEKK